MQTKIVEATQKSHFNWGKFLVGVFDNEWEYISTVSNKPLLKERGYDKTAVMVIDLETHEGGIFYPSLRCASYDLNTKHQIWVCPMFEPFLNWLYDEWSKQLEDLPSYIELEAVESMQGYRRTRKNAN